MGEIMSSIYELLPDHEALLNLEVEELARVVLQHLQSLPEFDSQFSLQNFTSRHTVEKYPGGYQNRILMALREAWAWLEIEGLIVPTRGFHPDMVSITRKGENIKDEGAFKAYRKAKLLPKQLLHFSIVEDVWSNFLRGKCDTAIFEAFKAVEIAVRNACGYAEEKYGVDLMRKAFHVDSGPLTDQNRPKAERTATEHLFVGAMGLYKNPHSHRNVSVTAEEAVEIIMFASHLLRVVDSRQKL
ncbi:TIGR02391 family protein [Candidatus Poribacteria bacterium]|nr:TIGR02391 family protein [Candidatus Poribacteria bacterium]MYB65331.1 TIGR02391 family protein [Candidatus Poribacteria bacterium]